MTKILSQLSKKDIEIIKRKTAVISVFAALILTVLKISYSTKTASLSLLASGVDSFFDILASSINLYAIKESVKPADREHQYGHGKVESLAALFQSTVILISGITILYQGIMLSISDPTIHDVRSSVAVMIFSSLVSIALTARLRYIGNKYNSQILITDSLHYLTDIYQNLGILIAMILIYFTGIKFFDSISAIIVSAYIFYAAGKIFIRSINCLMDRSLPENTRKTIIKAIESAPQVNGWHMLRTRSAGTIPFIDVHIVLDPKVTLAKAHTLTDEVEQRIRNELPNAQILIHPDPYDDSKSNSYHN